MLPWLVQALIEATSCQGRGWNGGRERQERVVTGLVIDEIITLLALGDTRHPKA